MILLSPWFWYNSAMKSDGRFKKGSVPWNKGVTGYMGANRTSFKKGHNSRPLAERFWEKVKKYNKCWEWIGYKDYNGYGKIHVNGKALLAHRVSFSINVEPVEQSIVIMHICDNPSCVRPDHLRKGTQTDNLRDMAKKGRWGNQHRKNI